MEKLTKYIGYLLVLLSIVSWACKQEQAHIHTAAQDHSGHSSAQEEYYTCSMHPTVRSDKPGNCPICGMALVKKMASTTSSQASAPDADYYTCPMHPSIRSDKPGSCPICGMDLVKKESSQNHENMILLNARQQLLINLRTDTAHVTTINENNLLLGTVSQDEEEVQTISARVRGRIEKLYVRTPGEIITKGQLLYALYSEDLLAAQTDFVQALKQYDQFKNQKAILEQLIQSSKNKLLLWGLSEKQIQVLAASGKPSPTTNFYSAGSGTLSALRITEGAYVEEGTSLFEIADLNSLWIEAQVYPQEFNLLQQHPKVQVEFESLPGSVNDAELVFSTPALEKNQKIGLVRFAIQNPGQKIKPGMMAYVRIRKGGKEALVIPKSALLLEKMKTVWVERESGMFERRMVTTGVENKREVEILSGITAGEKVVSSGAYLLNSEFVLQQGGAQKHNH